MSYIWKVLVLFIFSFIWSKRNKLVFKSQKLPKEIIVLQVRNLLDNRVRQLRSQWPSQWTIFKTIKLQLRENTLKECCFPTLKIYSFFDGGSRQNPGIGGAGSWLLMISDNKYKLIMISTNFQESITNNEAEMFGLIQVIEQVQHLNTDLSEIDLNIGGDINIIIKSLNGKNQIKNQQLKRLITQVQEFLPHLNKWEAAHKYRKFNKGADWLANRAMDQEITWANALEQGKKYMQNDLVEIGIIIEEMSSLVVADPETTTRRKAKFFLTERKFRADIWSSGWKAIKTNSLEPRSGIG